MLNKETNLDPHAKSYFKLIEISQSIEFRIKILLQEYEITHGQYNILRILKGAKGEPLTAKTIKTRMIVNYPDVTRLVDRLVKKGLVNREKNPENRREVNITLLSKGNKLLLELDPIMKQAAYNFFREQISHNEAVDLTRILSKIALGIKEEIEKK